MSRFIWAAIAGGTRYAGIDRKREENPDFVRFLRACGVVYDSSLSELINFFLKLTRLARALNKIIDDFSLGL